MPDVWVMAATLPWALGQGVRAAASPSWCFTFSFSGEKGIWAEGFSNHVGLDVDFHEKHIENVVLLVISFNLLKAYKERNPFFGQTFLWFMGIIHL